MNTYYVEFDGNDYCTEQYYTTNNYKQLLEWVREDLEDCGGGHADIYKEVTHLTFTEDIEI